MNTGPGSAMFGTSVIRTEEVLQLAQIATNNGLSPEQAMLDIEMLDDMLAMSKYRLINNNLRFTPSGRVRKNSSMLDLYENRINQRVADSNQ